MHPASTPLTGFKLQRIPNEIFVEILQNVGDADLTAVCRVSKPFFGIGVHLLYRAVNLETVKPECIPLFCRTVASTPYLARMVRSLRGWKYGLYRASMSSPGVDIIALALESFSHLTQLESLSINMDLPHPEHHRRFLQWRFPHLRSVSLALTALVPVDALILAFLRNHPGVERVENTLRYTLGRNLGTEPILLPRLQTFRGAAALLPLISAGEGTLTEAKLLWPPNLDVRAIVLALRGLAREDTPFVLSNDYCDECFTEILDVVGREMPNTRTLQMKFQDPRMLEKKIDLTKRYLSPFRQLAFLSIGRMFGSDHTPYIGEDDDGERLATEFGEWCPTLRGCCFTKSAWKRVGGHWEECSVVEFQERAGITLV